MTFAFPAILRELRRQRDLTQDDLSRGTGFHKNAISFWELGSREPGARSLIILAMFFEVSVDYLLGLENEDGSKKITFVEKNSKT